MHYPTKKEDLYNFAKGYGFSKDYKRSTTKVIQDYLSGVADQLEKHVRSEGMGYGWEMAQRRGVRYIMLPKVESWLAACKNLSGRARLEGFRVILMTELSKSSRELDRITKYVQELGYCPEEIPMLLGELKQYEQMCLEAYATLQA